MSIHPTTHHPSTHSSSTHPSVGCMPISLVRTLSWTLVPALLVDLLALPVSLVFSGVSTPLVPFFKSLFFFWWCSAQWNLIHSERPSWLHAGKSFSSLGLNNPEASIHNANSLLVFSPQAFVATGTNLSLQFFPAHQHTDQRQVPTRDYVDFERETGKVRHKHGPSGRLVRRSNDQFQRPCLEIVLEPCGPFTQDLFNMLTLSFSEGHRWGERGRLGLIWTSDFINCGRQTQEQKPPYKILEL